MTELRSAVGRAELVRLLARGGSNEAASAAALLGFSPPVLTFELPAIGELAGAQEAPATAAIPSLPVHGEKLDFKPIPFLRVGRVEYNDNEGAPPATPVPKLDLDPPRTGRELPVPPLVAWPRLWRVLEDVFRSLSEGERLDIPRLVGEIARGQVLRRLPRQWVAGTGRVRLVLDRSRHLVPFWSDQRLLELNLRRRLGPYALEVRYLGHAGPMELLAEGETEGLQLVVSDLGFLGTPGTRETWKRLGEKWRGVGARLRALVPCPPQRWDQDLAELWNATEWENPKIETRTEAPPSAEARAKKLEALQKLVAPLVRVEPGLLRELRQLLGRAADAGTEADLWALFPNPSTVAATPPPAVAEWRQKLISERMEAGLQRRVLEIIRNWHRQLPPLILAEEIGIHAPAGGEAEEQQCYLDYLRAACAEIEARGSEAARVAAWFERWNGRMTNMPADEELVVALIGAWRRLAKEGEAPELPEWASPALLAALEPAGELRKFGIWQRGNEIVLGYRAEGSPIGEIRSSGSTIQVVGAQPRPFFLGTASGRLAFELEELPPVLRLISNLEAVELVTETRPLWASAAGRDHYGLWADLEVGGVVQRMRYIRPGRFLMGSPETEIGRYDDEGPQRQVTLTEGFWLANTPCTQELWQELMGNNPSRFQGPKRPVEQVSWEEVQSLLKTIGGRIGGTLEAQLPTEAQWEYACRAVTQTSTYAGEEEDVWKQIAWYSVNSGGETHEVAQKLANPWGLYDTLGNLWEWCADFWSGDYDGASGVDPEGPAAGSDRVCRGGSWIDDAGNLRAAYRNWHGPGIRDGRLGFRFSLGRPRSGQNAKREKKPARRASPVGAGRSFERGSLRAEQFLHHPLAPGIAPNCAAWGEDRHGVFAVLRFGKAEQKLRFIPPGSFLMGSPESQQHRLNWEGPQHIVTLTEGFWLADTPCTQALWQEVMGNNPSRFRSPRRPVEQVSWDDTQSFLRRLEEKFPGLAANLPTEAQWEYACRAGTTTSTYAGDLIVLGTCNAPLLDEISWYSGNSGIGFELNSGYDSSGWPEKQFPHKMAGSREVGLKRPNEWGLYDMLGNVWEWCADLWSIYSAEAVTDPVGPAVGTLRVFRGGSWINDARYVRAVYRFRDEPGIRLGSLGFRFLLGQLRSG